MTNYDATKHGNDVRVRRFLFSESTFVSATYKEHKRLSESIALCSFMLLNGFRVLDACVAVSQQSQRQTAHETAGTAQAALRHQERSFSFRDLPTEGGKKQPGEDTVLTQAQQQQNFGRALQNPQKEGSRSTHDKLESFEALLTSLAVLDMTAFLDLLNQR